MQKETIIKHFEESNLITNITNEQNSSTIPKDVVQLKRSANPSIFDCEDVTVQKNIL